MNPIYKNTVIYKIVCKDLAIVDLYVGSTTDFKQREINHKTRCKYGIKFKLYDFIRNNGGWSNFNMLIIEMYPCNTLEESTKRERQWCDIIDSSLNMINPYTSFDERKEYLNEHSKKYHDEHKEYHHEYIKKYNDEHKEFYKTKIECCCGGCFSYTNKWTHNKTKKHRMYLETLPAL